MADTRTLTVKIRGDTSGVEKALRSTSGSTKAAGMSFTKMAGAVAVGTAAFAAARAGYLKLKSVATDIIDTTVNLTKQTKALQRNFGLNAKEASGLVAVFNRYGMTADDATKSLTIFQSKMIAAKGVTEKGKNAIFDLGIKVQGADGHLRNMNAVLLDVADKFKNDIAATERAAKAKELFGRAGVGLLPILMQGRQGIMELTAQAEKYGLILTEDNIKSTMDYIVAQKNLSQAMTGVKLQIGNVLLPILASLATKISEFVATDKFRGWVSSLTTWLKVNLPPAINYVTTILIPSLINIFNALWPIIKVTLEWFGRLLKFFGDHEWMVWALVGAFAALKTAMFISKAAQAAMVAMNLVGGTAVTNAGRVGKLRGALMLLAKPWQVTIAIVGVAAVLWGIQQIKDAIDHAKTKWNDLKASTVQVGNSPNGPKVSGTSDVGLATQFRRAMGGRAAGGPVYAGRPYMVGERGREMFVPNRNGRIVNNQDTEKTMQSSVNITLAPQIGMFAGMPTEYREIAERMWVEFTRIAKSNGINLQSIGVRTQ